jgi:integrase
MSVNRRPGLLRYEGKRGAVWRIRYRDATGKQVMETVGAERDGVTQTVAARVLRERRAAVDKGYHRPKLLTFDAYAETWLEEEQVRRAWAPQTVAQYPSHLRRLRAFFGSSKLDAISRREVRRYIAVHMGEFSATTVNRDVTVLHDVLGTAFDAELIASNPAERAPRPKCERREWRILTPGEVARVHKAFEDEMARTMFLTLVLTAVRRSELLDLRWRDVDLLAAVIRVAGSKTPAARRSIALAPGLLSALEARYKATAYRGDGERVFCHPEIGSRVDGRWFAREFRKALKAAGITDYVRPFHDLRHTALTNGAAAGASPIALMAKAGHTDMRVTRQYLHLAGEVFPDEEAALERRMLGAPEPA